MSTASDASSPDRPAAYVTRVTPEINDSLADFFRLVWGAEGNGADIALARAAAASTNPVEPGNEVPEFVFVLNGKVVGYLGAVPVSFWNGSSETPTYWLKGFMVHPDHRNGPIGFNLLKEALKHIGASGVIAAAPAARRLLVALGFVECGALPNAVTVLRPIRFMSLVDVHAVVPRLPKSVVRIHVIAQRTGLMAVAGVIGWLAQYAWRKAYSSGHGDYRVQIDGGFASDAELNELWAVTRHTLKAAAVRDGAYLPWRYKPARGSHYEAANVRDSSGRLVSFAVVRRPALDGDARLRGVKLAVLSDILFAPTDAAAGAVALQGAEQIALRMGADALLCSATAPAIKVGMRRRAYVSVPANVFLLVRDPAGALGLPTDTDEWWVTRGDAKADDAF